MWPIQIVPPVWQPLLRSSKTSGKNYPEQFQFKSAHFDRLAGTDAVRRAMERNEPVAKIVATWQKDLKEFEIARKKFWLYP